MFYQQNQTHYQYRATNTIIVSIKPDRIPIISNKSNFFDGFCWGLLGKVNMNFLFFQVLRENNHTLYKVNDYELQNVNTSKILL